MLRSMTAQVGCHDSGYESWVEESICIVLEKRRELVLRKGGDIERQGYGVRVLGDGGGKIRYDKEVVWGVATSDDVVWLYW